MSNVKSFPGVREKRAVITDYINDDDVDAIAIAVRYKDDSVETMWLNASKADIAYFIQALTKDLHEWMEDAE